MDPPQKSLKQTISDYALSITKAAVAGIPLIGGPVNSLMNDFIMPEFEKRKEKYFLQLGEDLKMLEHRLDSEVLKSENFTTIFTKCFKETLATHKKEKIDCYRAIVLNTAIKNTPNEDEQEFFLHITSSLTSLHLKLLKILNNPTQSLELNREAKEKFKNILSAPLISLFTAFFPQYDTEFLETSFKELTDLGLIDKLAPNGFMMKQHIIFPRTTDLGKRYLEYITLPSEVTN